MHPMPVRRYLIIIERQGGANISAYAPDLPGCVGSAATIAELEHEMGDAIALHIDGLRDAGSGSTRGAPRPPCIPGGGAPRGSRSPSPPSSRPRTSTWPCRARKLMR